MTIVLLVTLTAAATVAAREAPETASVVITDFDLGADGTIESRTTTASVHDGAGRLLRELEEFDAAADGTIDRRVAEVFTYDAGGNLVDSWLEQHALPGYGPDFTEGTRWTYDASGRAVASGRFRRNADGTPSFVLLTQFAYDHLGHLVVELSGRDVGGDGEIEERARIDYTYDSAGRVVLQERVLNDTRFFTVRTTQAERYDAAGHRVQTLIIHDTDFEHQPSPRTQVDRLYDAAGRLLQVGTVFDDDGDGQPNSLSQVTSTYDGAGNLVEQLEVFDSQADGLLDSVSTKRFEYDASGRLVRSVSEVDRNADGVVDERSTSTYLAVS